jgi:DNA polymerase III delta prime subunit
MAGFKDSNSDAKYPSFAEIFADRVYGGHNQNAILLFSGKPRMGKSLAALRLAFDCSLYFAEKLGGYPTDYFILNNVAILTAEETIWISKIIKHFEIYIIDVASAEGLSLEIGRVTRKGIY